MSNDKALRLDPIAIDILTTVLAEQPEPYGMGIHDYNYRWAEFAMALLTAERTGYLDRAQTIKRLKGLLDAAERCERRGGFWYDGYNKNSYKATNKNVYFQGWWLYALMVLKNAYPEFRDQCTRMLSELDYTGKKSDYKGSHVYDANKRQIAADINPDGKIPYHWSLINSPAGEGRSAYMAYSYVTGDISPWLLQREPDFQKVEGRQLLNIWMQMNFEFPLLHNQLHDVGYYERSYELWKEATRDYMKKHGMWLVPTKQSPLTVTWHDENKWPITEHRESMSYITWNLDPNAPVAAATWIPSKGISRYYDNWNFFWSHGGNLRPAEAKVGEGNKILLKFWMKPSSTGKNPVKLDVIRFPFRVNGRPDPLVISLNGRDIVTLSGSVGKWKVKFVQKSPTAMGSVSTHPSGDWYREGEKSEKGVQWLELTGLREKLNFGLNRLELWSGSKNEDGSYSLYNYDTEIFPVFMITDSLEKKVQGCAVEIMANGQHDWFENPFAFIARIYAVHGYRVCDELLDDERYLESLVAWVGPYTNKARLARWVHNLGKQSVEVVYSLDMDRLKKSKLRVEDMNKKSIRVIVEESVAKFTIPPGDTCRIIYAGKK